MRWLYEFQKYCRTDAFARGAAALSALPESTDRTFDAWRSDGIDTTLTRPGLVHAFLEEGEAESTLSPQRTLADSSYKVPDSVLSGTAVRQLEPALNELVPAAYVIDGEGLVNPAQLVASLALRLGALGVKISEHSRASNFVVDSRHVPAVVVNGEPLDCDTVVVGGGTFSAEVLVGLGVPIRMQAGKGYSFAVDLPVAPKHPIYLGDRHVAVSPLGERTRIAGTREFSGNNRRLDWRWIAALANASRESLGRWFETGDDLMGLKSPPSRTPTSPPHTPCWA